MDRIEAGGHRVTGVPSRINFVISSLFNYYLRSLTYCHEDVEIDLADDSASSNWFEMELCVHPEVQLSSLFCVESLS